MASLSFSMARGDALPSGDEVTRWIKPKLVGHDDDGGVIVDEAGRPAFIFPAAFELRDDEGSLSLTWLQRFAPDRADHLPQAAEAVRRTTRSGALQAKSAFAIAQVGSIKDAGLTHGSKLRIIEDPIVGNEGHCEIRRFPQETGPLQAVLASEVFAERHLYGILKQPGWSP